MPALVIYQILDRTPAHAPTADRALIEHLARTCVAADAAGDLDATVIETRYNVVRSNEPHTVAVVRQLRDYLPAADASRGATDGRRRRVLEPRKDGGELVARR